MLQDGLSRTRTIMGIASLLISSGGMTLSELCAEFNISKKDMRQILEQEIKSIGVPPFSSADHVDVLIEGDASNDPTYVITQRGGFRVPARLLDEEAIALTTLLSAFDTRNKSGVSDTIGEILRKIRAAAGMSDSERTDFAKAPLAHRMEELLRELNTAVDLNLPVEIEYFSAEHRQLMTRRVHPYLTFHEEGRFYLRAFCELRQAIRSFRCDRIRSLKLDEEGEFRAPKNAKRKPTATPGWDGTRTKETFCVRFEPPVAEEVARDWESPEYPAKFLKDGTLELKIPLFSRSWAIGWVLSFGPLAELISPEPLREQLVDRVEEMLASGVPV